MIKQSILAIALIAFIALATAVAVTVDEVEFPDDTKLVTAGALVGKARITARANLVSGTIYRAQLDATNDLFETFDANGWLDAANDKWLVPAGQYEYVYNVNFSDLDTPTAGGVYFGFNVKYAQGGATNNEFFRGNHQVSTLGTLTWIGQVNLTGAVNTVYAEMQSYHGSPLPDLDGTSGFFFIKRLGDAITE